MKINSSLLRVILPLVGVLAFAPASLSAASTQKPAYAFPVDAVNQSGETIEPGNTAIKTLRLLGSPDRRLSDNVWLYFNHSANSLEAGQRSCDILVVTLNKSQQIEDMKLVNSSAAKIITQDTRHTSPARVASTE